MDFTSFHDQFEQQVGEAGAVNQEVAFSTASNPFASVTSECDEDVLQQHSMVLCGLNMSFLHDWIRPAGEPSENNGVTTTGNDIFGAFDSVENSTPSAANAFADFDTAWGDVAQDSQAEKTQPDRGGFSAKFDAAIEKDRSPPRRSASGKDKLKTRKPRRKSGSAAAESSGGGEGLNASFSDMNVSNPDADLRKHRRERGDGEKRAGGGSRGSGGDQRRRRPKEGEEEGRSAPRRNRRGRDASRTTG